MKKNTKRMLSLIMTMVMLFTSVGVFTPTASAEEKHMFNGHYYQIIEEEHITWYDAKAKCEQMGGHLATVTSEQEDQFLINLVKQKGLCFVWLGASDLDEEHNWRWVTGEPFNYTNWITNEPNNGAANCYSGNGCTYDKYGCTKYSEHIDAEEDCLGYYPFNNSLDVAWNDYWPDDARYTAIETDMQAYICEWESAEQLPSGYDFETDRWPFDNANDKIDRKIYTYMYGTLKGTLLWGLHEIKEHGICFGMALSTASTLYSKPYVSDYNNPVTNKKYDNLIDIRKNYMNERLNISALDFISNCYTYQFSSSIQSQIDNPNHSGINNVYNAVKNNSDNMRTTGIQIIFKGESGNHGVYAIGIDGNDILINDSNVPNDKTKIIINGNNWQYSGGELNWSSEDGSKIYYVDDITTPYDCILYDKTINTAKTNSSDIATSTPIDTNKHLIAATTDSFSYSQNDNMMKIQSAIGDESATESDTTLYWLDGTKTITAENISSEIAELKLVGNETKIETVLPASATADLTIDEKEVGSADFDVKPGDELTFSIATLDENENSVSTTITGTASGDTVTATQTKNGVSVEGFDSMTITYETEDGSDTEEIKAANGEKINITTDDDKNEVSTDYECKHDDENHDGICDNCNYDFTAKCNHYCHSESKFIQFLFKIFNLLNRIFGLEQYCSCGKAHW